METINDDPIAETGLKIFKVDYLYPIQRYVIANTIEKKNQIVIFPTGGGKSLCFQLPVFFLNGLTLVIVPLLSLMEDQLRRLNELRIDVAVIKGGQSEEERKEIIRNIRDGRTRIVYTTPESLSVSKTLDQLKEIRIAHLVIDEAHCVSEWGESFRPAYLELNQAVKLLNISLITAFTATASETVIDLSSPDRPNISYSVIPTISKAHTIFELLNTKAKPLVIFTRSRKNCELLARIIKRRMPEQEVFYYHAGLDKEERTNIERWFLNSNDGVLTATSAYGMGIDKGNLRAAIHLDIPLSVEAYLQEAGRIGRDQKPAEAILLYSYEDVAFTGKLDDDIQKKRYRKMLDYARSHEICRREQLLSLLNYEFTELCSGCDICNKTAARIEEGKERIMRFIKRNKRRFSFREVKQILSGKNSYEVRCKHLHTQSGFGLLSDWETDDIEEALSCLVSSKEITIPTKGFWKRRLSVD